MNNNPIGVLDSGLGGLTVLQSITQELPYESIIYIGDSLNTPYGAKSEDEIYLLAKKMLDFLVEKEVKLIVIACNTITVTCLDKLRKEYPHIPIVATVPVIKTAAAVTHNKLIGVLSTTRTATSEYQKHLITAYANGCSVFNYGTDRLVPLIEQGKVEGGEITAVLHKVLAPFQKEHVDTLVLGCTHFPFVKKQMQKILGSGVQLLDSSGAIARQVARVLQQNKTLAQEQKTKIIIYTTGDVTIAKKLVKSAVGKQPITVEKMTL